MDKAKKTNGIPKEYIVIGGITIVVLAAYLFFQFKFQTNSLDIGTDQSRNSEKKVKSAKITALRMTV